MTQQQNPSHLRNKGLSWEQEAPTPKWQEFLPTALTTSKTGEQTHEGGGWSRAAARWSIFLYKQDTHKAAIGTFLLPL